MKGANRLILLTQSAISKILKRVRQTGYPNQRRFGHHQSISTFPEDQYLLKVVCVQTCLSRLRLRAHLIRRIGRRLSVRTITLRLFAAEYHSHGPARCPKLTLEHHRRHRQWARRHCVWTAATGEIVSSLTSQDSSCISQMDELGCVGGRVKSTLMSMCREQMVMSVHLSSYGLDLIMAAKLNWELIQYKEASLPV